ncbi:MAG: indolepyruvate oxidoreductase subunit beta [Bacteroidales bacterium]|jgi:indolepyruvate ferredoxin oxidoreductase beta subunit|nr:indolepyruvate oxidoreductase subunit beta [Bacteroidales bacterium]
MKIDLILCGVGGQGILSIAAALGAAALRNNLYLKQAETHGMSQRGGDVVSHMRISDKPIHSDLIPIGAADMILSVEPMEALRYLPFLSPKGYVVTNTTPIKNIPNYPSEDEIMKELKKLPNVVIIDADTIAEDMGSKRSMNIVMLGAAAPFLDMPYESFENGLRDIFGRKGDDVVNSNLAALKAGYDFSVKNRK